MKQELANKILISLDEKVDEMMNGWLHNQTKKLVDYTSTVTAMFSIEIRREIAFLKNALSDPDGFEEVFKARCAERELDSDNTFGFRKVPDGATNEIYWEIAKEVFEPASMKEILAILLPGITWQLKADIQYTHAQSSVLRAYPVLIEDDQLAALELMEPEHALFLNFTIPDDGIFDTTSIALFPLGLQSQFKTLLSREYPTFASTLYQHNDGLKALSDDILASSNKGKTPKMALEDLMKGLSLAGERMMKDKYASPEANAALKVFFDYFKSLDTELQMQLRAMAGNDERLTLGKVIDCEIEKGTCVETAAVHLHSILENNSQNPLMTSSPGMSKAELKELNSKYGPKKALDTKKSSRNLSVLPAQLFQKISDRIKISSIDDLLSFLINLPVSLYDNFWEHVRFDKTEKRLDSLFRVIRQGALNLEQKQALADALVKHAARFDTEVPFLFMATLSDDLNFFKRITSHYTKEELEDRLQQMWDEDTIFHYSIYTPAVLEYLLEIYPETKRLEALKAQDCNEFTLLHYLEEPVLIKRVLQYVPESERLDLLTIQNYNGETVLHRNIKHPAALKAEFESLTSKDKIKALFIENDNGKTLLHRLIKHPDVFEAILQGFSKDEITDLCKEDELWPLVIQKPDALQVLYKFIPAEQARQFLSKEGFSEVFKVYFKSLPDWDKLVIAFATINDENLLQYAVRDNLYVLKTIFKYLPKPDLLWAALRREPELIGHTSEPGQTLLHKIAKVPELFEIILDRLHKKAYYLATMADAEGKIILDYILEDPDSCEILFGYLSKDEELQALTHIDQNGEKFLFKAARYPESFKAIFDSVYADTRFELMVLVDANNENLLQKAVRENNTRLFKILLKYSSAAGFELIKNTIAHDGNTLLFHCLDNLELLKITSRYFPNSLLEHLLDRTDEQDSLKLHDLAFRPEAIRIIFENLTEEGRSNALSAKNDKGQNLVHLAAVNPELLKAISPWLPANSETLKLGDNFGNTPLHHFMLVKSDNTDLGDDLPEKSALLVQIYESVEKAFSNYKNHHDNRADQKFQRGFEAGFFSVLRHGENGKTNARNFCKTIMDTTSASQAIDEMDTLFTNSRAYHTHSFTSYLFDEINNILRQHQLEPIEADKTGHYSKDQWQQAKTLLDGIGGDVPEVGMFC